LILGLQAFPTIIPKGIGSLPTHTDQSTCHLFSRYKEAKLELSHGFTLQAMLLNTHVTHNLLSITATNSTLKSKY